MTIDTVVGLDIGTTTSKALIRRRGRPAALIVQLPTRWHADPAGHTELGAAAFLDLAVDLLGLAARAAESAWGDIGIRAVSVGGIAESGILLDRAGRPSVPAIAWFDHRGEAEVSRISDRDPAFAARFPAVTGLPWKFQATIAKLLWLSRRPGIAAGSKWLSVPEWIVHALGGDQCREPSLASRTGLIDQGTGRPWPDALALAGLPATLLPDEMHAGQPAGLLTHDRAPRCAAGAVLSVAGHDHAVAAVGIGMGPEDLFNSTGTADVLARAVPGRLDESQRAQVVAAHWSAGTHVVPGSTFLLAGASGGLLLRRVLTALGADHPQARDALDTAARAVDAIPPGLVIEGDGRTDDGVVIRLQDGATPAAIWAAATRHTARLTRKLLDDIEPVVGTHRAAVAAGGWTRMRSVRAAKATAIDRLTFSAEEEPGAVGAALLAEYSLMRDNRTLSEFLGAAHKDPARKAPAPNDPARKDEKEPAPR